MEIRDSYELYNYLESIFKDRIDINPLETLRGGVPGKLDGYIFNITYRLNNYLLISVENKGKHILDEMLPVLKNVCKEPPIISYDMKTGSLASEDAMPTIEFDMKDPEGRIKELVNGNAWSDDTVLSNIKILYGEHDLEYYTSSFEDYEESMKNAKIYGIYPGSIKDTKEIDSMDEIDLYLTIDSLGGYIYHMNRDIMMGRIDADISEEEYALEYLVYQTKKFGVELDEPKYGSHIKGTPSYWAWYRFYSEHFDLFSDSDFKYFIEAKKRGEDISHYLPVGNWKDNIPKSKTL